MDRVLVVEDDERLGRQVVDTLAEAGYDPLWVRDGTAVRPDLVEGTSLIVLDLMLPGEHGLDLLKRLRRESDVPVLVLSARNETADKVRALKLGADDYVTKPFWPDELLARVAARMRRPVLQRTSALRLGDLAIDLDQRRVSVAGEAVDLTRVEFDLLAALVRRQGAAVSRAWLAGHVLDPEREGSERTLDVHISRLRKKLGPAASAIATVWGIGYRIEAPGR
ncbi:MAG TPA: response regulator transcription factor [Vicinamibacteria bacterium]|nr:response regulator transcription factor [Vicinamibacteria bacterium]